MVVLASDAGGGNGGVGGSHDDIGGRGGDPFDTAGAGGSEFRPTASQVLAENAEEICATTCARLPDCGAPPSSVTACLEACPADLPEIVEIEACAELMLEAVDCVSAPDCAQMMDTCDALFDQATVCAGDARMCIVGAIEPGLKPPGDRKCEYSCEAGVSEPAVAVECVVILESDLRCRCTLNGEPLLEVLATSCDEAYAACFE